MKSISDEQLPLISHLIELAKLDVEISSIQLEPMDDGGMGSQKFSSASIDSKYAGHAAEVAFMDADGIEVSATLDVDQFGNLFELDMFKADFSKLEKWPDTHELNKDN